MPSRRAFLIGVPTAAAGAFLLPPLAGAAPPGDLGSTPAWRREPAGTPGPSPFAADQTPINIRTRDVVAAPGQPRLLVRYPSSVDLELEYVNKDGSAGCGVRDHEETVEAVVPAGAAWVVYEGVRYDLLQFHFHGPSEHRVDGVRFPLEQHYVHRSAAGDLLVLGLFLRRGGHHTVQDRVLRSLPAECGPHLHLHGVDLRASLPHDLQTYRYDGSLTTAPFTPGVRWHVLRSPLRVSDATIDRFAALFPDGNSREIQPLGGRVVRLGQGHLIP